MSSPNFPGGRFVLYGGVERRQEPRIHNPFPATVRGVDKRGREFQLDTVVDGLSASGLYLRLPRHVEQGAKLSILIRIASTQKGREREKRVAVRGVVVRTTPQADGGCGVAVVFKRHRFT